MPGDVNDVNGRLARARGQEGFACERVYCLAGFASGDVEAGYTDPTVLGDAQDAEVEQGVVKGAQGQGVRDFVRAALAVPADVGRLDRDGVTPERAVEAAHRALVGIGAQDLFGESVAPWPQPDGPGDRLASGEVQSGHVEIDGGTDQFS
jgi:hypothetical protein